MNIPLETVKSSAIRAVGYDPDTETLALQMATGLYHYGNVPPKVHAELMASDSIGSYFATEIRGRYPSVRMDRPKEDN